MIILLENAVTEFQDKPENINKSSNSTIKKIIG
jgi:hypothetical protein